MDETISLSTMNDFEILKNVGQGAYGKVFKVRRKSDNQIYAMKVINISKMDKKGITSTLNEVRILCSLGNDHVVAYKDAFINKQGSELCVIMEFIGGGDLSDLIKRIKKKKRFIEEEKIWEYTCQIILGLKALHDMKIIHRDIKSANLFLTEDFESIKVGDLNVAKIAKNDLASTQIGTPYYLAPEIWLNKVYDYRCDVFSLGCCMYEMAALCVPFEAVSIQDLYKKITKGSIKRLPSKYSDDLYNCIKFFLNKDPLKRPNIDQILRMPLIKEKMQQMTGLDLKKDKQQMDKLMETIRIPRNLNLLKNRLPGKKYRAASCENLMKDYPDNAMAKHDKPKDFKISKLKSQKSIVKEEMVPDKKSKFPAKKTKKLPPIKKLVSSKQNLDLSDGKNKNAPKMKAYNDYSNKAVPKEKEKKTEERKGRENRFNDRKKSRVSSANPNRKYVGYGNAYRPGWWG